jgi:hypothetical protein
VAIYESVPSEPTTGSLDYNRASFAPVRGAIVELLAPDGRTLATTATSPTGNYSFTLPLTVASVSVRVRAQMASAQHNFRVLDNTRGAAPYAMTSPAFPLQASTTNINLFAPSGWGFNSYTGSRTAAPFAILDVAYRMVQRLNTVAPNTVLPALAMYWSPNNIAAGSAVDPNDAAAGRIGTSSFVVRGGQAELFLLGDEDSDTDEYDTSVVAHELGHFMQHAVSRDDSIGGAHSLSQKLDMRLAFSEGFASGWAGMVNASALISDSSGTAQSSGYTHDMSKVPTQSSRGWYNESTVAHLLWQWHEDAALGFDRLYRALVALKEAPTFTTVFSFIEQVSVQASAAVATLRSSASAVGVNASDGLGTNETNDGGLPATLPVYRVHTAALGSATEYCVTAALGGNNKLGNTVFLRLPYSGVPGLRQISVTRTSSTTTPTDPDFTVITGAGQKFDAESSTPDVETLTVNLGSLGAVMAMRDYNLDSVGQTSCFAVKVD